MAHTPNRWNVSQPTKPHWRKGHILVAVLSLGVITAGGVAAVVTTIEKHEAPKAVVIDQLPDDVVLKSLLQNAGVSPESLAVAGLTGQEAASLLGDAVDAAVTRLIPYRVALENWQNAGRSLTQLRRAGGASDQALANAREQVQLTRQTMDGLVALVSSASLGSLDGDQTRRLNAYGANAGRQMPLAYMAKAWSPSEALDIMQALQQKSANESRGEEVDSQAAALLTQVESNGDVAVAASSLDVRLAAIQTAWDQAISGGE